jgi:branched-chain amino acid transport system substrate-binding protein
MVINERSDSMKRLLGKKSVFALLALVTACGLWIAGAPAEAQTIKIGMMAPLTGPAAADGLSAKQSCEMLVEQVNAAGGINGKKIELIVYDDQFDSKQAVLVAQKMIQGDKVVAGVSGSYSFTTRAAAQVFQEEKIPFSVGYALHPAITEGGKYVFRVTVLGHVQGRAGGFTAGSLLKAKTVSMLIQDNDFGQSLAQGFQEYAESLGVKVVSADKFKMNEKEFSPVLTKIKQLNPDLIYNTAYPIDGALILKQAADLGIKTQQMGSEGLDSTKGFLEVAGKAAEGIIITTNLDRDSKVEITRKYLEEYQKKFGFAPDMTGASTYDALLMVIDAIKKVGTDADKIVEAFRAMKGWQGVTGQITAFTPKGEVIKNVELQVVKNGVFRYYGVVSDPKILMP